MRLADGNMLFVYLYMFMNQHVPDGDTYNVSLYVFTNINVCPMECGVMNHPKPSSV